jgi:putative ABC transport system permease protein
VPGGLFKYLPLVWANLRRRRMRLAFTLASIIVAFLLFALLEALRYAFSAGVDLAGADRLMVLQKVSIIQPLPYSYANRIRALEGVKRVSSATWFGGVYQDERNQIPVFPVDGETYLQMYPEFVIDPEQRRAWLADRRGALVGRTFAQQFAWKVGATIPMRSSIWRKADGGDTWDLQIDGIYDVKGGGDTRNVMMHYDYFNEARATGGGRDLVGWYVLQVDDPQTAPAIAKRIDAMFANSPYETRTSTEKAVAQQFANQVGNVGAILIAVVTAVFFTMLLVTANTMGQSVRERTNEIGVLKTLGYSGIAVMSLVLLESVFITVLGGVAGMGLALGAVKAATPMMSQYLPIFGIPTRSYLVALTLMLGLGLLAGVLPAAQALHLQIVDALRRT